MKRMTVSLQGRLEARVTKVLENYSDFRSKLVATAHDGINIKDALREEDIWEERIRGVKGPLKGCRFFIPIMQNKVVSLGSPVTLLYPNGESKRLVVDGADYQEKNLKVVSHYSRLGALLMGKRAGELLRFNNQEIEIEKIEYPW